MSTEDKFGHIYGRTMKKKIEAFWKECQQKGLVGSVVEEYEVQTKSRKPEDVRQHLLRRRQSLQYASVTEREVLFCEMIGRYFL